MRSTVFITFLFAACCWWECQPKDAHQQTTKAPTSVSLNQDFLQKLSLPSTVMFLGLEKKADSTLIQKQPPNAPKDMTWVPGGWVQMGSEDGLAQEQPTFWAQLKPFWMDTHPVTVGQFRQFVEATGYKTEAERFGNGGVIDEATDRQWMLIDGANWRFPMGSDFPAAEARHPVTQVSWNDAMAYAQWAGKRLPCEIEWEHAARNAQNSRNIYSWGNEMKVGGRYQANIWQGSFPQHNNNEDGYATTSPVGAFGKTPLGLTDMSGNVWEWQSNWKFDYEALFRTPTTDVGLSSERAQRGGSFLCEPTWCHGYRVSGRSGSSPETSLFHVGFRCVQEVK